jgi:nucleotide sugar dehydrogenase
MSKPDIGIIGNGFVGNAVAFGFSSQCGFDANIRIYDIDPLKSTHTLNQVCNESKFIFISVPTLNDNNGNIDLSVVNSVFHEINNINKRDDNYFLLRSTIVPSTTREISNRYPDLNIIFNPEFLTERTAKFDFINPSRIIFGKDSYAHDIDEVVNLFDKRFSNSVPIGEVLYEEAELIKYMCNCFFATKLSFLNEMYLVSEKLELDWNNVLQGFLKDSRIGHSHNKIALDGELGYGGACLPKDSQAMVSFIEKLGLPVNTLKGAILTNKLIRSTEFQIEFNKNYFSPRY